MRVDSRSILFAVLLSIVALSVSCGDDEGSPAGVAPEEIVLATITGAGSGSGPDEPPQPYAMVIEIGVSDHVIPAYTDLPDPIVFSNRTFGDDTDFIAGAWNTRDFGVAAERLTDGGDNTVYVGMYHLSGGGSSRQGPESQMFDYDAGLSRVGPDLQGYTVTGLRVQLDIEVTENAGRWTEAYTCTLSVLGY